MTLFPIQHGICKGLFCQIRFKIKLKCTPFFFFLNEWMTLNEWQNYIIWGFLFHNVKMICFSWPLLCYTRKCFHLNCAHYRVSFLYLVKCAFWCFLTTSKVFPLFHCCFSKKKKKIWCFWLKIFLWSCTVYSAQSRLWCNVFLFMFWHRRTY